MSEEIVPEEQHNIELISIDGRSAIINFHKGIVTYEGDLPVDESARLFFDAVGELLRCECDDKNKKA